MGSLSDLKRGFERFFFEPVSPVPIAALRIALGLAAMVHFGASLLDWDLWYGPSALITQEGSDGWLGFAGLNLLRGLSSSGFAVQAFLGLGLAAAAGMTLGVLSRFSCLLVYLVLQSVDSRNTMTLDGGDTLLRISIFFMIFTPSGAALSVDRAWGIAKGWVEKGPCRPVEPWAQRLIQLQIVLLYLATFLWKAQGADWADGTAVYWALRLEDLRRFSLEPILKLPLEIQADFWRFATWATLAIELGLVTLVWFKELRYPVLIAGLLMHAVIALTMKIFAFEMILVVHYLLFLKEGDLDRRLDAILTGTVQRLRGALRPEALPSDATRDIVPSESGEERITPQPFTAASFSGVSVT